MSGWIGFVMPPNLPDLPGGACGCTVMRVSISSVCAPPEAGALFSPAADESGDCVPEFVVFPSLDGCEAGSSARALVARHAAKTSVNAQQTNFSFVQRPVVMPRSLGRLPLLGPAILPAEEHDLNCRHNHKQDDRTDKHSADDDSGERLLHLAANAG